jgi:DNA-binding Lrp family transcriptional regulator
MVDDLDKKIIRVLNQNARRSFREIAREVGTSVTGIIHRIKKFEESGAIKGYIPDVNPEHFGFDMIAIIALRISQGRLLETQEDIASDPRAVAVYDITGDWDSLIIGRFKGREDLNSFIKTVLAKKYVDRTVTHIVLNVVKEEKRIVL